MSEWENLKEDYWRVVCRTRKTGRVSEGIVKRTEAAWEKYDAVIVKEALRIHISRYPQMSEKYTLGIMRNLKKQQDQNRKGRTERTSKNAWHSEEQREYDFEALERELLGE